MSKTNFQKLIESEKPVLIDFYADWCGPCKAFSPVLTQLKNQLGDDVRVIKIDVDKNPQVAQKFQIRGVPTLILFDKGNVNWKKSGAMPLPVLKQELSAHL